LVGWWVGGLVELVGGWVGGGLVLFPFPLDLLRLSQLG
jgi:hypothetical protein